MIAVRIGGRYPIVSPRAAGEVLQLHPHDALLFPISCGTVVLLKRPANLTRAMRELHREIWPADLAAWPEQERAS